MQDATGNVWLAQAANWLIAKPLAVIGLLLLAFAIRWVLHRTIDRLADRAAEGVPTPLLRKGRREQTQEAAKVPPTAASARRAQRARTMASLLKSIASSTVYTIIAIMVVAELGYNVAPLIASAGIIGVALGFGAQSLVKDFLSGIFMIFEDQYGVGDIVDMGVATGTVEAVGLRISRLRDVNGTVWHVRNGEILRVGNMSQNWSRTVLDVTVAYTEDLNRVQQVLREVARDVWEDDDFKGKVIEEPEVWGVESLDADGVLVRVTLKTAPLEQWAVARRMRERIKARFDHEGIEIPFAQRVVWHRQDSPETTGASGTPRAAGGSADGTLDS